MGVVTPRDEDIRGVAFFALLAFAVMIFLAFFAVVALVRFVTGWRQASVGEWILLFPIVLYGAWKLFAPVAKYARGKGWIPESFTRRLEAALSSHQQSPLGKFLLGAALVFLVVAALLQSFTLSLVVFVLAWAGILVDFLSAFGSASWRKRH
jgi:hypothetical protein